MKTKITMNSSKNLSVESAYELFIRKCRVKNLSEATITSYNNKVIPFVEFCNGGDISAVTVDTVDAFTDMLKKEHNVNDVSVVSYLRSVRAFLYYCMECNYMTSFKIHLPKCNKEIKEIYTDEQLEKLLKKPDTNTCSFTEYKTWVFENYLIATGNRLSTALNVQIRDLNFEDGIITLRKTKNRKQQIIPLSASLADVLQVAEFRNNKIKPYLYADVVNAVGRWYDKALLTVEKASGGHSVIERLRYEHHYMNMTKYKTYDEFNRTVWNVGFSTNNKTKSIAVNDAREWFDKGMVGIVSNYLLEEMKTFVAEENGSFNAVIGSHDDLVSAMWLCIQGFKNGFWYPF